VQVTGLLPVQTPAVHTSVCVHASPSWHAVPSETVGFEHMPVVGSQVPAVWHESLAAHTTGFEPVQTPAWHVSVCVHALPSLHAVPSGAWVAAGQAAVFPVQVAPSLQGAAGARHTVIEGRKASGGHAVDEPLHTSAASQGPATARHV
jgi:hypothetical protein